jgi:hypothetical protein
LGFQSVTLASVCLIRQTVSDIGGISFGERTLTNGGSLIASMAS